ncbi:MAG: hypothetical protein K0S11_1034 [Gammaproteobacteria bacterium]|nr:hypothetical protein [Gammaproteobacteria bacterium]
MITMNTVAEQYEQLKSDLKNVLPSLVANKIVGDYYIQPILLPAINRLERDELNPKEQAERLLSYLHGSDELELNKDLIYLVRNKLEACKSHYCSYVNEHAYKQIMASGHQFLQLVKQLEYLIPGLPECIDEDQHPAYHCNIS